MHNNYACHSATMRTLLQNDLKKNGSEFRRGLNFKNHLGSFLFKFSEFFMAALYINQPDYKSMNTPVRM